MRHRSVRIVLLALLVVAGSLVVGVGRAAAIGFTPKTDYATGAGHAPKSQIQQAIQRELKLRDVPDPPDVADALAVALCHFHETRNHDHAHQR